MDEPLEIREIPGFPLYYADNQGRILSGHYVGRRRGRFTGNGELKLKSTTLCKANGYPRVCLAVGEYGARKRQAFDVHYLVALAFLGPKKPGQLVRHRDGDKTNPAVSNLVNGTAKQNRADMRRHRQARLRLSPKLVRAMRQNLLEGQTLEAVAKQYNCSLGSAFFVGHGLTWKGRNCWPVGYRDFLNTFPSFRKRPRKPATARPGGTDSW